MQSFLPSSTSSPPTHLLPTPTPSWLAVCECASRHPAPSAGQQPAPPQSSRARTGRTPADEEARFDSGAPLVPRAYVERAPAAPHSKVHSPTGRGTAPVPRPQRARAAFGPARGSAATGWLVRTVHPPLRTRSVRVILWLTRSSCACTTVMDLSCPRVACLQHRQARARGVLTLTPARAVRSGVLRAHLFQMQACSALSLLRNMILRAFGGSGAAVPRAGARARAPLGARRAGAGAPRATMVRARAGCARAGAKGVGGVGGGGT